MIEYHADAPDLSELELAEMQALAILSQQDGLGFGLAGAHRTGKTTLCEYLHKTNPAIPFVRTSTKEAAAKFGFDVNNPGSYEQRLDWQEYLLDLYGRLFDQQGTAFFTDRTPLDLASYLIAEVPTGEIDPDWDRRTQRYLDRCIEMADRHFALIALIQPGIPHVQVEGAPLPNVAYQEKLNLILIGLGNHQGYNGRFAVVNRQITDMKQRANLIAAQVGETYKHYRSALHALPRQ